MQEPLVWIKYDEEHLPQHNSVVMITAILHGKRLLLKSAKWSQHQHKFYVSQDDFHITLDSQVTHWMPYPKPAED